MRKRAHRPSAPRMASRMRTRHSNILANQLLSANLRAKSRSTRKRKSKSRNSTAPRRPKKRPRRRRNARRKRKRRRKRSKREMKNSDSTMTAKIDFSTNFIALVAAARRSRHSQASSSRPRSAWKPRRTCSKKIKRNKWTKRETRSSNRARKSPSLLMARLLERQGFSRNLRASRWLKSRPQATSQQTPRTRSS